MLMAQVSPTVSRDDGAKVVHFLRVRALREGLLTLD